MTVSNETREAFKKIERKEREPSKMMLRSVEDKGGLLALTGTWSDIDSKDLDRALRGLRRTWEIKDMEP